MFVLIVLVVVTLAIVATWVVEWRRRRSGSALAETMTQVPSHADPRGHVGIVAADGVLRSADSLPNPGFGDSYL